MILPFAAVSVSNAGVREHPPQELVDLLAKLGLARAEQVRGVRGRVRRLARDLPGFESVWVDALAQARVLTPFQAAEINAGRGAALELGPYVLHQPLPSPGYARVYRAFERQSRRWVRLSVIAIAAEAAAPLSARLKALVHRSSGLSTTNGLLPIVAHGAEGGRVWVASHDVRGQTAADWMVHHGRFPPAAVLEIAQQMLAALLVCEQAELVHGDLRAGQVLLDSQGKVWLPEPGLRLAVRPDEGFGYADLPPDAYECLAPERVSNGTAADMAGDLYACGCLWWHLLAGRPPVAGATSLAKLRAGQTAKIVEIRQMAPDAPAALTEIIRDCLRRDPRSRPESIGRAAVRLATPSANARRQLLRAVRRSSSSFRRSPSMTTARRTAVRVTRLAAAAGAMAALIVGTWPYWGAEWVSSSKLKGRSLTAGRTSLAEAAPDRLPDVEAAALTPPDENQAAAGRGDSQRVQPATWEESQTNVLELEANQYQRLAELPLNAGMIVRGRAGQRAVVRVPDGGLAVDVEDVHFENIDFISGAAIKNGRGQPGAMILLRALRAEFANCSFQSAGLPKAASARLPAAIAWFGLPATDDAELSLPTGELSLNRCVFRGVSAAIYCELEAALIFDLAQSLHLGPGPLLALAEAPQADEPITLAMNHLTLRNATGLLECRYDELAQAAGGVSIQADDCAFVPSAGGGLLVFKGAAHPAPLIEHLTWTGQGSVLARETPVALWHGADGKTRAATEETIQVDGMVRTEVGFAGEAEEGPGASRIVRWQAPLRSTEPPGIGEDELSLPGVERK